MTNHEHESDHEQEEAVFLIADENGNEHEFVMIYSFETNRGEYAVLIEKNHPEKDGVLFKIEEEDGEAFLSHVEDDEEWEQAVKVYEAILEKEASDSQE